MTFLHTHTWFFLFGATQHFKAHLAFPYPGLKVSHFYKEPWFLLLKNSI